MFVEATEDEARGILGAMRAVTCSGRGEGDVSGRGHALLAAAARIVFRPALEVDVESLEQPAPADLARRLADPQTRQGAARVVGAASLVDGDLDPGRLRLAVEYASALGVSEAWVRQLLETARGHLEWVKADMVRRNVATFPGLGVADGTDPDFLPYTGSAADRALADRYRALADLPDGSFGRAFYGQFELHGFLVPGEVGAFNEAFSVRHDAIHVLSDYDTSVPGELLVSTFTGAMHGDGGMGAHILPVIYEWHVGVDMSFAVPPSRGMLEPERFWVAWDRGAAATRDVLAPGWDFFSQASLPLDEVRAAHGIPPLR